MLSANNILNGFQHQADADILHLSKCCDNSLSKWDRSVSVLDKNCVGAKGSDSNHSETGELVISVIRSSVTICNGDASGSVIFGCIILRSEYPSALGYDSYASISSYDNPSLI